MRDFGRGRFGSRCKGLPGVKQSNFQGEILLHLVQKVAAEEISIIADPPVCDVSPLSRKRLRQSLQMNPLSATLKCHDNSSHYNIQSEHIQEDDNAPQ